MNPLSFMSSYTRKPQHHTKRNVAEIYMRTSYRSAYIPLYSHKAGKSLSNVAEHIEATLSADDHLVKNPTASYFVRVKGDAMNTAGIFDGDVVVVDRSIDPNIGQIVLAEVDGQFTVRYLGQQQLTAANAQYESIYFADAESIALIGVVTGSMRKFA